MAIGIWTPVLGSTIQLVFAERLLPFANRVKSSPLVAGTHMLIRTLGCHPVFIHATEPTTDAQGLTGVPVGPGVEFVMPRVATVWVYSPYDQATVHISVGALT